MPVIGWNQWVKCVAPFSTAHSFIAVATTSAMEGSSGRPSSMVFFRVLKTAFGSLSLMTDWLNTFCPNISIGTASFLSIVA